MNYVILGATGATGTKLVEQALAAGHQVTAVARQASDVTVGAHPRLAIVEGRATEPGDLERILPGHDAVLSAIGSRSRKKNTVRSDVARAVVAAMQKHGIARLVWLDGYGVGDSLEQARRSHFIFGRIIIPLLLKDAYVDAA